MKCQNCNADIQPGMKFCPTCGKEIIYQQTATSKGDLDFKFVKCSFDKMNETIEIYKNFGYTYENYQSADSQNVLIGFCRNKFINHKKELLELEKAYDEMSKIEKYSYRGAIGHFIASFVIANVSFILVGASAYSIGPYALLFLLLLIPSTIILILGIVHTKKIQRLNNGQDKKRQKNMIRGQELLRKARSLLD